MRWKTKPIPQIGDTRQRGKFAWFPTQLDDGYIVWFEHYRVTERYENVRVRTKFHFPIYSLRWKVIKKD